MPGAITFRRLKTYYIIVAALQVGQQQRGLLPELPVLPVLPQAFLLPAQTLL